MPPNTTLDSEALDELFRAHVGRVTAFVARRTSDPHLVADVVAATFLEAVRSTSFDHARGSPLAWLIGIARHRLADAVRAAARELPAGDEVDRLALAADELDALDGAIDALRLAPALRAALAQLPVAQRELLELVAHDGLAVNEAAAVLGIPAVAARMR